MDRIIDLTDFSFFFLLFSFSKSFSDYIILHSFTKDKYNKYVTLFTTVFLYTIYDRTNQLLKSTEDNLTGFDYLHLLKLGLLFLIYFVVIAVCTEGTTKKKLLRTFGIIALSQIKWILSGMTESYFFLNEHNGVVVSIKSSPLFEVADD